MMVATIRTKLSFRGCDLLEGLAEIQLLENWPVSYARIAQRSMFSPQLARSVRPYFHSDSNARKVKRVSNELFWILTEDLSIDCFRTGVSLGVLFVLFRVISWIGLLAA